MGNTVNNFLADISATSLAPAEKQRSRHNRKKGIMDLENDFLTVGGGGVVQETDDPDDDNSYNNETASRREKPASPRVQRQEVSRIDRQNAKGAGGQAGSQNQNRSSQQKPKDPPVQKQNGHGNSNPDETEKKLNDLIKGQARIIEDLDLLKTMSDMTAFKTELQGMLEDVLENVRGIIQAPHSAELADTPPMPDSTGADLYAGNEEQEKKYFEAIEQKEAAEEFAEKAKKTIESLAQQLSDKEAEVASLQESNRKLTEENKKMRDAIMQRIMAAKSAAQPSPAPQYQEQPATSYIQQPSPAPQSGISPNTQQIPQTAPQPQQFPQQAIPPVQQGQFMPQQAPMPQAQPQQAQSNIWGNNAPPAVDLLADEEPKKKKRGLFGRRK